jgi:hypothetical protein
MLTKNNIKYSIVRIVFLTLFFSMSKNLIAQIDLPYGNFTKSIITISGEVNEDGHELKNANVSLLKNNVLLTEITTDKNGSFSFTLKPENQYMLLFSKQGYVSKKIYVNTENIPSNTSIVRSGIDVELFREIDGVDFSILNDPIGKFYYTSSKKNIDYDKDYTNSIIDKLEALQNAVNKRKSEIKEKQKNEKIYSPAQLDSIEKKRKQEQEIVEAKRKEIEAKRLQDEEKRKLDAEKIKAQMEAERQKQKEKEQEINEIKARNAEIKAQEEKMKLAQKEQEIRQKEEANRIRKEEEDKKLAIEQQRKQQEEELLRKKAEEMQLKLAQEEQERRLIAEKNWKSAQESIERKKAEEKEKAYQDSLRQEEIKQKIKNNASLNTYTKSDTIYEMTEEEAKAVFNEKLTKEELNLLLKELAKKYPEGFTTIVKKYPNFKVTTIIKVVNSKADEYKMIQYKFASFYKKNNDDITEAVFKEETSGVKLNIEK